MAASFPTVSELQAYRCEDRPRVRLIVPSFFHSFDKTALAQCEGNAGNRIQNVSGSEELPVLGENRGHEIRQENREMSQRVRCGHTAAMPTQACLAGEEASGRK